MHSPTTPRVLALIIADSVIKDTTANKHTIVGTYDTIQSKTFPAIHRPMEFYLVVDNVRGREDLALRVSSLDGKCDEVFRLEFPVKSASPNDAIERRIVTPLNPKFPEPGHYVAEVLFEGEAIYSRRIIVNSAT